MVEHHIPATGPELRSRALDLLEFSSVREAVADYTHFAISKERALMLQPVYEAELVAELQQETTEARLLLDEGGDVDLALDKDPRPLLARAAVQGLLGGDELMTIADALDLIRSAKLAGGRFTGKTPHLRNLTRNITDLRPLSRELRSKLSPSGELLDDASPLLRELRNAARDSYKKATRALEVILDADSDADYLQEHLFTVRAERLVLPVKADFRGKLPGIVHGVSDSGATLFIEPMSNVGLTNSWREATAAEQEEALRILRQLANNVSKRVGEINHALEITAHLDLALAKARYAIAQHSVPIESGAAHVHLVAGRHPLLSGNVVPVSLVLAPPASGLVITGPNTGGKTVALKTLGLLVLMQQSGLQLPCDASTQLPLLDGVYADIGDLQSIQEAESTFSSHISNISAILTQATEQSLVLLDELGTSTDPEEGSALARAILAHLAERRVPTVVTTHHRTVAALAETTPGLANGSVELDPVTLKPTYRLTLGLPGRSYAMAVAERLGLDAEIIRAAKRFQDPVHRETESLIAGIQEEQYRTRLRLQEAEDAERQASELARELEARLVDLAESQVRVVDEVKHELQNEARRVQAKLKQAESAAEWQAFRNEPPPPRVLDEARGEVADVQRMLRSRVWGKEIKPPERKVPVAVGDLVEIGSLGFTGTVLTEPGQDRKLEVLVGSARIKMDVSRLRKVGVAREPDVPMTTVSLDPKRRMQVQEQDLDLRGLRLHDALERLDHHLDQCLAQGVMRVRVIHGKGTGVLRQGVWRHLAGHPAAANFDSAHRDRGGDGATEVELS